MPKRIRVRAKRLDAVDETKLSLALWLLSRDAVVDKTTPAEAEAKDTKVSGRTDGESA